MKKNLFLNWNFLRCGVILILTCAGFCPCYVLSGEDLRAENERLKAENRRLTAELAFRENENNALRKELIETLDIYSTQAGRMRRMEASSAGTIETLEPVYTGAREMELAADLQTCISSMKKISAAVLLFTDDLIRRLPELSLDQVETAKLRIQINELRSAAEHLARLAAPPQPPGRPGVHRILELDPRSKLVVLNGGFRDGLREGVTLRYGEVVLKVVAVRNFVSAAAVISGTFEKLAVGCEVKTSQK
jgi:hypothetical protein